MEKLKERMREKKQSEIVNIRSRSLVFILQNFYRLKSFWRVGGDGIKVVFLESLFYNDR